MGTPVTLNVYGQLLASQNDGQVDAGTYTDTITATVEY
jgi:spore coat protein U-like protein